MEQQPSQPEFLAPDKVEEARRVIREALVGAQGPVVLTSFGKDSVVLFHLVREQYPDVPGLWLRYDFKGQHLRHKFAYSVIADWGMRVYDYQPMVRVPISGATEFELVQMYSTGGYDNDSIAIVIGTTGRYGECVLDIGKLPLTPRWDYPWDVTFHGQREDDSDPIFGTRLPSPDGQQIGVTRLFYPLRTWTERDIWDYTSKYHLPVNKERYMHQRMAYSGDEYDICSACIAGDRDVAEVYCPKVKAMIPYQKHFANWPRLIEEMKGVFRNANSRVRSNGGSAPVEERPVSLGGGGPEGGTGAGGDSDTSDLHEHESRSAGVPEQQ